jgi:hypothetical protein
MSPTSTASTGQKPTDGKHPNEETKQAETTSQAHLINSADKSPGSTLSTNNQLSLAIEEPESYGYFQKGVFVESITELPPDIEHNSDDIFRYETTETRSLERQSFPAQGVNFPGFSSRGFEQPGNNQQGLESRELINFLSRLEAANLATSHLGHFYPNRLQALDEDITATLSEDSHESLSKSFASAAKEIMVQQLPTEAKEALSILSDILEGGGLNDVVMIEDILRNAVIQLADPKVTALFLQVFRQQLASWEITHHGQRLKMLSLAHLKNLLSELSDKYTHGFAPEAETKIMTKNESKIEPQVERFHPNKAEIRKMRSQVHVCLARKLDEDNPLRNQIRAALINWLTSRRLDNFSESDWDNMMQVPEDGHSTATFLVIRLLFSHASSPKEVSQQLEYYQDNPNQLSWDKWKKALDFMINDGSEELPKLFLQVYCYSKDLEFDRITPTTDHSHHYTIKGKPTDFIKPNCNSGISCLIYLEQQQ